MKVSRGWRVKTHGKNVKLGKAERSHGRSHEYASRPEPGLVIHGGFLSVAARLTENL